MEKVRKEGASLIPFARKIAFILNPVTDTLKREIAGQTHTHDMDARIRNRVLADRILEGLERKVHNIQ